MVAKRTSTWPTCENAKEVHGAAASAPLTTHTYCCLEPCIFDAEPSRDFDPYHRRGYGRDRRGRGRERVHAPRFARAHACTFSPPGALSERQEEEMGWGGSVSRFPVFVSRSLRCEDGGVTRCSDGATLQTGIT